MKIVRLSTRNSNKGIVRELKAHKVSNGIFISDEELKNMDTTFMIA